MIKRISCCLILFFVVPAISFGGDVSAQTKVTAPNGNEGQSYVVSRVLDGDTFRLSNGQNLKLAGINTPELHNMPILTQEAKKFKKEIWAYRNIGVEAYQAVQHFLDVAKNEIKVESDVDVFDQEGNLLGYVYISLGKLEENMTSDSTAFIENGNNYTIFLNAYLVKMGLAEVLPDGTSGKYHDLFLKLQQEAKENKKGMWK